MRTSRLFIAASLGSILLALATGIASVTRRFLTNSELKEAYQRLETYGTRR